MIRIGKTFRFEAAHHLPNHEGSCKTMHGHSYKMEVVIEGTRVTQIPDPEWGMVMDYGKLKEVIDPILDTFDHKVLNDIVSNPTAENIVIKLVSMIKSFLPSRVRLVKVRLWETTSSYAEWTNENL